MKLNIESKKFWKEAIFETLIRDGFIFDSNLIENAQRHGKAYSQLSNFIENFESNSCIIFK